MVNWLHLCWFVTETGAISCQEWPGLCGSVLGSEHFCSLCWQVGRAQSQTCVCHVTFSSSVNVVDYFLRDRNWLPRIRPPSILSRAVQDAGCWGGVVRGVDGGGAAWSRGPRLLRRAGDDASEAVGQVVTQSPARRRLVRKMTNKCNLEALCPRSHPSAVAAISAVSWFLKQLDASTGWRITPAPCSTWPSLPLLSSPHSLSSVYCWCLSVSQTFSRAVCHGILLQDMLFWKISTPCFTLSLSLCLSRQGRHTA